MYSYCYICSVLGILFHCVALCIVCVQICTVLLTSDVNPIVINKYIISCLIIKMNVFIIEELKEYLITEGFCTVHLNKNVRG